MEVGPAIKILVLHYKNGQKYPLLPCYEHIWAGKSSSNEPSVLTGDNSGENISDKNKYYSELTGIYWFWKNQKADVVGTCHYRRFFTIHPIPIVHQLKQLLYFPVGLYKKRSGLIYCSNASIWEKRILSYEQIKELLSKYDAILPQARRFKYTVEEHFKRYHKLSDLQLMQEVVQDLFPDYLDAFKQMRRQKRLYANNMFILKDAHYQQLMDWMFQLLFEFEKRIDLKQYKGYQERLFGFLNERLITTWFIHHKQLTIKELPLIYLKKLKAND